jgi:hypothetical protein
MAVDYDDWKTSDPADRERCEEHGYDLPCLLCRTEYHESCEDAKREEGA